LPTQRFEQLFGTPHGTDLLALAAAHRLPAATVDSVAELQAWLERPGPWLMRVPSTRDANVVEHRRLNDAVVAAMSPG
jgi:2-succinyl-5-enolpyruvyl-6-hydroxy-3-cyclohexene-1-carboxylate synthase